ncbi:TetR/AcrR family transcriptional regulator C-terminal domain-containing protein [Streptomyces virginiae]|uniref:TetR/AcrR family transcriptional regulator C-terminal domain-containing protein n=1 Tax=Streptomyces virginiae TaxID=1961 RepID=UPI0022555EAA|nr:TetR/AcrR family transcriptional regulator C-terminal domain-containing protein [Streptomyces virginiae]MCX4959313.1 TetR/AcrR family transcriptional regulator C-terminal domain-containing protein [Streptomyces virginiae]MCX5178128.1 TetR/AcrR family transcriptional regulator C-terminal domain-containing protein [Streptomyces virginiae]
MTQTTGAAGAAGDPPYLRIVATIRRRIADGELAPGDRVPSTRQIAAEWGVALATATKALTTLRLEGLVEARPRIGTVVAGSTPAAPARRRPSPATDAEPELTLDRIVRAAVEIADAEGLAALSMRGVAARLGVAPMSTYRYVPSKEELVLLMADAAYGEESPADAADATAEDWRARVEVGARTLWRIYRKHPWLARIGSLTRPLLVPNLMVHGEWTLGALDGHGLDPTALFDIHVLLYSHVHGLAAHLELEADAEATTGQSEDQWMDSRAPVLRELVDSGRFPTFAKLVGSFEDGYDLRLDTLFELGLRALLDGLTPVVEGPGRSRGPGPAPV